jgi:putative ubiquitin-RnfH superfamily antitoxin RatB of RatAB toxin-antitoxin module
MVSVRVEVVHALAGRQVVVPLQVPEGTTAGQAVAMSGLPAAGLRIGIGGMIVAAMRELRDGDRVELLRSLAADPKEARRLRARRRRR